MQENGKRLKSFIEWYKSGAAEEQLRRCCLCLRLSLLAVRITAQKPKGTGPRSVPLLVRLGKGEVQTRVFQELLIILNLVHTDENLPADTVPSLLETTIHILVRFYAWYCYPAALWKLTAKYNLTGYVISIRSFLSTAASELDAYSLDLQEEARSRGRGSVEFLMSDGVQQELTEIVETASVSSLDVERKHNTDKLVTKRAPTTTVAGASAKSILHTVRRISETESKVTRAVIKEARKRKFTNFRSLAIQRNPDLFARPRGIANHGEEPADRRAVQHAGDPEALEEYIQAHRTELEAEAQEIRGKALADERGCSSATGLPKSTAAWLHWMEIPENETRFRTLLKTSGIDRRRYNQRIVPREGLPAAPRLQAVPPHLRGHRPRWYQALLCRRRGFFALVQQGEIQLVFFAARCRWVSWGVRLHNDADMECSLRAGGLALDHFQPARDLAVANGVTDEAELHSVDLVYRRTVEQRLVFSVESTDGPLVPDPRIVAKMSTDVTDAIVLDDEEEKEPVSSDSSVEGWEPGRSSGNASVVSSAESAAIATSESEDESVVSGEQDKEADDGDASAADDGEEADDESDDARNRAARGANIVENNGYFSFTDDPNYGDLKVEMHTELKAAFGRKNMSKSVTIAHYDGTKETCWMILKAWMVGRVGLDGNAWLMAKPARQRWWLVEMENLQESFRRRGHPTGGTGNAAADAKIREFCPNAF